MEMYDRLAPAPKQPAAAAAGEGEAGAAGLVIALDSDDYAEEDVVHQEADAQESWGKA